jgi:WD40 repeat protein
MKAKKTGPVSLCVACLGLLHLIHMGIPAARAQGDVGIVSSKAQGTGVFSVAFSPDGKTLAVGRSAGVFELWEMPGMRLRATLRGHSDHVWSLAFSPNGKLLASGSRDRSVRLWNARTAEPEATIPDNASEAHLDGLPGGVFSLAFGADSALLAAGTDRGLRLWNVAAPSSPQLRKSPDTAKRLTRSVAFSPDGKLLAATVAGRAVADRDGVPNMVELWDVGTGKRTATLPADSSTLMSLAFSPDGKLLATASASGALQLWTVATGRRKLMLQSPKMEPLRPRWWERVAFSPDGEMLASVGPPGLVFWDVATGLSHPVSTPDHYRNCVAYSPDGKSLAVGTCWDPTLVRAAARGRGLPLSPFVLSGEIIFCDVRAALNRKE